MNDDNDLTMYPVQPDDEVYKIKRELKQPLQTH